MDYSGAGEAAVKGVWLQGGTSGVGTCKYNYNKGGVSRGGGSGAGK